MQNQDRQAEALRRLERRLRGLRRTWQELRGEAGKANGGGAEARLREFDLALSGLGRELAALVREAVAETGSPVTLGLEGGDPVDAGSALMIMTLGAEKGTRVVVTADDQAALDTIVGLVEKDLDAD